MNGSADLLIVPSAVNSGAVIVAGTAVAVGVLTGPHSVLLSLGPIALAVRAVLATLAGPRFAAVLVSAWSSEDRWKRLRALARGRRDVRRVDEGLRRLRSGDRRLLRGVVGDLIFDLAVLADRALLLAIAAMLGGWAFIQLKRTIRDEAKGRVYFADDVAVASGAVL